MPVARYGGSRYSLKFFRGTSREELLSFVQEVLQIGEAGWGRCGDSKQVLQTCVH